MGTDPARAARPWVRVAVAGAVLLAALGGFALFRKGGSDSDKPVSDAEARSYFDRIVAAAQARDWDGLCQLAGAPPNCQFELDTLPGRDRVPTERPTIVESRFHEKQSPDGTTGRILVVEGTDGRGRRYRTEVMVSRYEGHLEGTNVVYWSSNEIFERDRNERRLRESDRSGKG